MSDIMTPIPFGNLMNWILKEHEKGAIFGVKRPFVADKAKNYEIFGRKLETPLARQQVRTRSWPRTLWHPMWQAAVSLS